MTKSQEELLAMRFGGATVAANLDRAIKSGAIIANKDGTLQLATDPNKKIVNWMQVSNGPRLGCDFLLDFMFTKVYARSAVPHGCRECYKVKVAPRTLRELVAAWQIAKRVECLSKWGIDLYNPYSESVYAGYFYAAGLDAARSVFKVVREAFSADSKIGADIPMGIKRGCSEYEAALGPSDQYQFAPETAELEAYLKTKFQKRKRADQLNAGLAYWIDIAFRIGDETYLDFTGGERLRPKTRTYDP